jgi:hypothetical protein
MVELLDDHGHIVQQADGAAGHKLDGQFLFKGVTPGHYILKTRALGRTWTRQVQAPVNATIHADITVRPQAGPRHLTGRELTDGAVRQRGAG